MDEEMKAKEEELKEELKEEAVVKHLINKAAAKKAIKYVAAVIGGLVVVGVIAAVAVYQMKKDELSGGSAEVEAALTDGSGENPE